MDDDRDTLRNPARSSLQHMVEWYSENIKQQLHVMVMMGGPSPEHDVSLKSGQGIMEALRRKGWEADPCVVPQSGSLEEASVWTRQMILRRDPDVIFIALHGPFGEDGTIQELCEEFHVAYTGSDAQASRIGIDKWVSRQKFLQAGLRVPLGHAVSSIDEIKVHSESLRYPLVVKPIDQGSSIGVSVVREPSQLLLSVREAQHFSQKVIVEEYVVGRELTVGVLDGNALVVVEIIPTHPFFDFSAKYTAGLTTYQVPAGLSDFVAQSAQEAARRAHEAVGARHFSRVDIILDRAKQPVILEINTIPGFTPTSLLPKAAACMGLSYDQLCEQLLLMALRDAFKTSTHADVLKIAH